MFPAHGIRYVISRAWHRPHFPGAWHRFHVFRRLRLATCFPALGTSYLFSPALGISLHDFPRLTLVTCFPALGIGYFISLVPEFIHCLLRPLPQLYFLFQSHLFVLLFCFSCFPLQTSGESDDLGESAQDKQPEVTRHREKPEARDSSVNKPPPRRY